MRGSGQSTLMDHLTEEYRMMCLGWLVGVGEHQNKEIHTEGRK